MYQISATINKVDDIQYVSADSNVCFQSLFLNHLEGYSLCGRLTLDRVGGGEQVAGQGGRRRVETETVVLLETRSVDSSRKIWLCK